MARFDAFSEENILVFLDGKLCKGALAANDEEGWVDVIDPAAMAPLDVNPGNAGQTNDDQVEFTEIKSKRKFGKVEFKSIKQ